jgi:hypothetical protein
MAMLTGARNVEAQCVYASRGPRSSKGDWQVGPHRGHGSAARDEEQLQVRQQTRPARFSRDILFIRFHLARFRRRCKKRVTCSFNQEQIRVHARRGTHHYYTQLRGTVEQLGSNHRVSTAKIITKDDWEGKESVSKDREASSTMAGDTACCPLEARSFEGRTRRNVDFASLSTLARSRKLKAASSSII